MGCLYFWSHPILPSSKPGWAEGFNHRCWFKGHPPPPEPALLSDLHLGLPRVADTLGHTPSEAQTRSGSSSLSPARLVISTCSPLSSPTHPTHPPPPRRQFCGSCGDDAAATQRLHPSDCLSRSQIAPNCIYFFTACKKLDP